VRGGTIYVEGKDPDGTTGDYGVILVTQKAGSGSQGNFLTDFFRLSMGLTFQGIDKASNETSSVSCNVEFDEGEFTVEKIEDHILVNASRTYTYEPSTTTWDVSFITEGAASATKVRPYGDIVSYVISETVVTSDGSFSRSFKLEGKKIVQDSRYTWRFKDFTEENMTENTLQWTETDENGSYAFEFKNSTDWNGDGLWFSLWLK
jgi:hypothetical protein